MSVLVVACPAPWVCDPDGSAGGHGPRLAAGHLIRNAQVLEATSTVDRVVLDEDRYGDDW